MISGTLWNQLALTLRDNPDLSYIKQVYEGRRYDLEPDSLPCIMLEPQRDGEIDRRTNNIQNLYFTVSLYAFSSNNYHEFEKTIVGGVDYKGILDITNDIRACLISSNTLGGNCIDVLIDSVEYSEEEKYPVRGLLMPIRIYYRQQNGV